VHLFWGDERCVPPDDPESNYGMVSRTLIRKIRIPVKNVHRIKGETDPLSASESYSEELFNFTLNWNGLPRFDLVLLGLGDDGHTASIFPHRPDLLHSEKICEVAVHPISGQKRITVTGRVLNNAAEIVFLVTGEKKSSVTAKILGSAPDGAAFPAAHIVPDNGKLVWLLDSRAAAKL
jgi:6-phosphogluconolactonase